MARTLLALSLSLLPLAGGEPCTWENLSWDTAHTQDPLDSFDSPAAISSDAEEPAQAQEARTVGRRASPWLSFSMSGVPLKLFGGFSTPSSKVAPAEVNLVETSRQPPQPADAPAMSLATLALPAFCSSLVLDGHNMSGPSMVALANALQQHPGTFSALTLRDAHAGDAEVEILAAALAKLPKLESINLEGNGIGDAGASAIARAIAAEDSNTSLRYLILENNSIGNEGARALASALASPSVQLEIVFLQQNLITDEGAGLLVKAIQGNFRLRTMTLWGNAVEAEIHEQLRELLAIGPHGRQQRRIERLNATDIVVENPVEDVVEAEAGSVAEAPNSDVEAASVVADEETKVAPADFKGALPLLLLLSHVQREMEENREVERRLADAEEEEVAACYPPVLRAEALKEQVVRPKQIDVDPLLLLITLLCVTASLIICCCCRGRASTAMVVELETQNITEKKRVQILKRRNEEARREIDELNATIAAREKLHASKLLEKTFPSSTRIDLSSLSTVEGASQEEPAISPEQTTAPSYYPPWSADSPSEQQPTPFPTPQVDSVERAERQQVHQQYSQMRV